MATTLQEITSFLDEHDLKYKQRDENTLITGFGGLDHYRDSDGDPHLGVVVRIEEGGEYLKVFAPNAYRVPLEDAGPVLQACAMIQWKTKLVQFEYDSNDGELRPIVEFPLEDASLTSRQLLRCLGGLTQLVDHYHPTLAKARDEGVVAFEDGDGASAEADMLGRLLGGFSPELLAEALRRADTHRRRN